MIAQKGETEEVECKNGDIKLAVQRNLIVSVCKRPRK